VSLIVPTWRVARGSTRSAPCKIVAGAPAHGGLDRAVTARAARRPTCLRLAAIIARPPMSTGGRSPSRQRCSLDERLLIRIAAGRPRYASTTSLLRPDGSRQIAEQGGRGTGRGQRTSCPRACRGANQGCAGPVIDKHTSYSTATQAWNTMGLYRPERPVRGHRGHGGSGQRRTRPGGQRGAGARARRAGSAPRSHQCQGGAARAG
jgi:hypothetical protein